MATTPNISMLFLSNHLKGYVPDGKQLGIAWNKFPCGINQVTEVKVNHNGKIRYKRPNVWDKHTGLAAIYNF